MEKGMLFVVSTPIGNLDDITGRAVKVLQQADLIAAEDTRRTLKLLNHLGIKKPLVSFHEHNKQERGVYLVDRILEGANAAIVSDAGTPCISDPGESLVSLAIENGITVVSVPGPTAAIAGLVVSGMPTGRFVFEGFLPVGKKNRRQRLDNLRCEDRTMVFYEAPHKLERTLEDMLDVLGDRRIALARELTKKFEQVVRCTVSEAVEYCRKRTPKGEYVLVLDGTANKTAAASSASSAAGERAVLREQFDEYVKQGLSRNEAVKKVARERHLNRRDVYGMLIDK